MDPTVIRIKELNPDIIAPITERMNEPEYGGSKIVVIGKPGCFSAGTKILMYDGSFKNVEDVQVGEQVMGDDSTPRNVLELCRNEDEMYEIKPIKGDSYTVNKMHKLVLVTNEYNKDNNIIEMSVEEYLNNSKKFQNGTYIFKTGVDFQDKYLDAHPYLIGLWVGIDSNSNIKFANDDSEIVYYFKQFYTENTALFDGKYEILLSTFRKYNLLNQRYIPKDFKINSRKNRLELLAGILDIEGSYDINSKAYEYNNSNEKLIDDVIYISRSLGLSINKKVIKKTCIGVREKEEGTIYRCIIYGNIDEIPCKILQKQFNKKNKQKNNLISEFSVVPKGKGKYYGFTLDGNHRFLLSTFDVVRNTGKSTLIASLLYAKKHIFPVAVAFSGTEDSNGFFRKLMPSTFVFNEYSPEKIELFIKRQKIAKRHIENPWAVIIIDDCTDDPRVLATPLQQGIYKRGRHWKCLYILSLQYSMDVKPVIRTNVDGVFILRDPSLKNRKSLWENYASIIPDFNLFCSIMDSCTDDFTALYIHNQTRTNNWQDCVFYYKAPLTPSEFKFGSPEYWQFHEDRFDPNYQDPFDIV